MFRVLLLLFLIVPIVEIYLLIEVGGIIGAIPTIFLIVFTAVLGALLIRLQGFSTLGRVQLMLAQGKVPAVEIMEGVILLICGALLLTPGFFTDSIGFFCLVPSFRRFIIFWFIGKRIKFSASSDKKQDHQPDPRTIEGEYWRHSDKDN